MPLAVTLALVGCGGQTTTVTTATTVTATTSPTTETTPTSPTTETTTTAPNTTKSKLETWCSLALGESEATVRAKMGEPHKVYEPGSKVAGIPLPGGIRALEWHVGNDILLASFQQGKASNLQAYAGAIGPQGATDIGCEAFRH